MIYIIDQTISSLQFIEVPDARVVFIAGTAHTLVVERSYLFNCNINAEVSFAADWVL